jgi:subtilisin-like proprotein convertase family protein
LKAVPAASGALVLHSTDVPKTFNSFNVFASSVINVPQSVTLASLKVQVNVTYPMDSQLRIDLVHIDSAGNLRSVLVLSDFVGAGANFQDTTFDDSAATPIAAGVAPFAGSYRPSDPLSALAGQNAQGTWVLEVGDFAGGTGTINSWSLIIQPASGQSSLAGSGAPSRSPAPVASNSLGGAMARLSDALLAFTSRAVGDRSIAGQPETLAAGNGDGSAGPRTAAREATVPTAVGPEAVGARPIPTPADAVHVRKSLLGNGSSAWLVDEVTDNVVR